MENWSSAASLKNLYTISEEISSSKAVFWTESALTVQSTKRFDRKLFLKMLLQIHARFPGSTYESFLIDMDFLLFCNAIEGPSIVLPERFKKMCDYTDYFKLKELVQNYKITNRIDVNSDSTTVTLTRIAQCFPLRVLNIFKRFPLLGAPMILLETMMKCGFIEYHPAYRTSAYFAIIPANGEYLGFVKALIFYHVLETLEINRKKGVWLPIATVAEKIVGMAIHTFSSGLVEEYQKEAHMKMYVEHAPESLMRVWSINFDRLLPGFDKIIRLKFQQKPHHFFA